MELCNASTPVWNDQNFNVPVIYKNKIIGNASVVDTNIKRVVLMDRKTLAVLASKNTKSDTTWELYSPFRIDESLCILAFDDAGNFNADVFDFCSLETETLSIDTETFDGNHDYQTMMGNFLISTPVTADGLIEYFDLTHEDVLESKLENSTISLKLPFTGITSVALTSKDTIFKRFANDSLESIEFIYNYIFDGIQLAHTDVIVLGIDPIGMTEDVVDVMIPLRLQDFPEIMGGLTYALRQDLCVFSKYGFLDIEITDWDDASQKGLIWIKFPLVKFDEVTMFGTVFHSDRTVLSGSEFITVPENLTSGFNISANDFSIEINVRIDALWQTGNANVLHSVLYSYQSETGDLWYTRIRYYIDTNEYIFTYLTYISDSSVGRFDYVLPNFVLGKFYSFKIEQVSTVLTLYQNNIPLPYTVTTPFTEYPVISGSFYIGGRDEPNGGIPGYLQGEIQSLIFINNGVLVYSLGGMAGRSNCYDTYSSEVSLFWEPSYDAVYHFNTTPVGADTLKNVVTTGVDGTPSGMSGGNLVDGGFGKAWTFDGVDDFVTLSQGIFDNFQPQGTVDIVFKTSGVRGTLISQDGVGWNNLDTVIGVGQNGVIAFTDGHFGFETHGPNISESRGIESAAVVNDGTEQVLTMKWDGINYTLCHNGTFSTAALTYGEVSEVIDTNAKWIDYFEISQVDIIGDKIRIGVNETVYYDSGYLILKPISLSDAKYVHDSLISILSEIETIPFVNFIPIMTSNTTPSGVSSASSFYNESYRSWKAFNGVNIETDDSWISDGDAICPHWIMYQFTESKIINWYRITNRNITSGNGRLVPSSWTFEGSPNGIDWDVLHTVVDGIPNTDADVKTEFICNNTKAYVYYKMHITKVKHGYTGEIITDSSVTIGEFEMGSSNIAVLSTSLELSISEPVVAPTVWIPQDVSSINGITENQDLTGVWLWIKIDFYNPFTDYYVDVINSIYNIQYTYGAFGADNSLGTLNTNIWIGKSHIAGVPFQGQISEIRMSDTAKSDSEILLFQKSVIGTTIKTQSELTTSILGAYGLISFDTLTYQSFTSGAWKSVVSKDPTVHGVGGDETWYYFNGTVWVKNVEDIFADCLTDFHTNNIIEGMLLKDINALTSTNYLSEFVQATGNLDIGISLVSEFSNIDIQISGIIVNGERTYLSDIIPLDDYSLLIQSIAAGLSYRVIDGFDFFQVKMYSIVTGSTWKLLTTNPQVLEDIIPGMDTSGINLQFKITVPLDFPETSFINVYAQII